MKIHEFVKNSWILNDLHFKVKNAFLAILKILGNAFPKVKNPFAKIHENQFANP